jgi:hypothetical protein
MSRLARAETMFSKPLALLFDPGSCTAGLRWPWYPSFVEEFWSPVRAHSAKKALVNQGAISACPFLRESARDLISLGRGLDSN